MERLKICRAIFLATILLGVSFSGWAAVPDRLNADSISVPYPERSLLLDIELVGSRLVAVGEQGIIIYSEDQGLQWTQAQVPTSVLLTSVDFVDANLGWAVGHDGVVLKSTDAGQTWQMVVNATQLNEMRVSQLEAYVNNFQEQPDVDTDELENLEYTLDDARIELEEKATHPLLDVFFLNAEEGFLLGAYGLFFRTQDGGKSWQSLGHLVPNPDGFHLNKMVASARGELYVAGEAGLLFRSDVARELWESVESPYEGSFFSLVEHDKLYVMGLRGHMYTSDDGMSWEEVILPKTATINAAVSDGKELFVLGQGGALMRKQSDDSFVEQAADLKRTLAAGVIVEGALVTVGAGGVNKVVIANKVSTDE